MDDGFFLFLEETDWCRRMWGAGWEVHLEPEQLLALVCFVLGASAIGLATLNHQHCEADMGAEGGDAHAGHGH